MLLYSRHSETHFRSLSDRLTFHRIVCYMKTLALETSGRTGSVAIWDSENPDPPTEISLPRETRTAESLLVVIEEALTKCRWSRDDLELIAVTQGPGSFTGLRIGCVTAKVLAFAVNAQLVGVNSLHVLAENSPEGSPLWCVMDAGRGQCVAARYSIETADHRHASIEPQLMETEAWLHRLAQDERVTGPLLTTLGVRLPETVKPLPKEYWHPRAECVARLGAEKFESGQVASLWDFSPHYYRLSAAEEKRLMEDRS